ncbi:MAG: polysaccharide biosynthesis tyrosine autokinase [Planctomycetes bacterium]|nr:polysaccharide biosynthesis tyrosine autokinase [Planctomycetota bacterium]
MALRGFEMHVRDYLRIVLKHLWVVILSILVVAFTVWMSSQNQPDRYQTAGRMEIRGVLPQSVEISEPGLARLERAKEFRTHLELMKSPVLAERVVAKLDPDTMLELETSNPAMAAGTLAAILEVHEVGGTSLVSLGLSGSNPEKLTKIVNATMEEYCTWSEERLQGRVGKIRLALEAELPAKEDAAKEARLAVQKYRNEHQEIRFEDPDTTIRTVIDYYEQEIARSEVALIEAKSQNENAMAAKDDPAKRRTLKAVRESRELEIMKEEEITLVRELSRLKERGLQEGHRDVVAAEGALADNRSRQEALVAELVQGVSEEYADLKKKIEEMRSHLEVEKGKWREYNGKLNGFRKLNDDLAVLETELAKHQALLDQATKDSRVQHEAVKVILPARVPTVPILTTLGMSFVFSIILGLALGIGLAFFFEYLDDTLKTREDVEKYIGAPLLGFVPYIRGDKDRPEAKDTITHRELKSTTAEAYRGVRTGLLSAISRKNGKGGPAAMVVTSAGPMEGKTTNAVNLSITLAHSGSRVLLVDADLRRPRIHKSLSIDHDVGLTNFLVGANPFEEVVRPTSIKNLDVVTCGPLPPNPYELLGSPAMLDFLLRAKKDYDFAVLDTPPMGAVSDALLLGSQVDGVIQIVSAAKTRRKIALLGRDQIDKIGAHLFGVILNSAAPNKAKYYGYYYPEYYKYYRRYYVEEGEKAGSVSEKTGSRKVEAGQGPSPS